MSSPLNCIKRSRLFWGLIVLLTSNYFCEAQGFSQAVDIETIEKNIESKQLDAVRKNLMTLPPEDRLIWIDAYRRSAFQNHYYMPNADSITDAVDDPANDSQGDQNLFPTAGESRGGGAIPNFAELIQLIENSVDGAWASDGGNSNIVPYQNGVRVDSDGVLQRLSPADHDELLDRRKIRPTIDWSKLGDWQTPSELRWIPLSALKDLVKDAQDSNRPFAVSEALLAGLARIDYLAWDDVDKTWVIGGPAGDFVMTDDGNLVHRTLRLPPVLLEDLITVGSTVLYGSKAFGCSIDPDEERLKQAYQFAQDPNTIYALRSKPKAWINDWKSKLGVQNTRVFGIPAQTTTALALLIADAEMKRMALGFDPLPPSIRSYWKETDLLNRTPTTPIIRWWYTLGDGKIPFDKERQLFRLTSDNVKVVSESQFYNEQGLRLAAMTPDIAADAFAKSFSQDHQIVQRLSSAQARLRHIFDLAVVFELIKLSESKTEVTDLKPLLQDSITATLNHQPTTIESIATSHTMPNGTVVAIASGGVHIDLSRLESRLVYGRTELSKVQLPVKELLQDEKQLIQSKHKFWTDTQSNPD